MSRSDSLRRWSLVAILAFSFFAAAAEAADGSKPSAKSRLAPLGFLVGGSWLGTFPDGVTTDEHRYEWVYDKKFVRDTHVVKAIGGRRYEGETIFAWNGESKQIVFWYWASDGGISQGSMAVDGKTVVFDERHTGTKSQKIRTRWEIVSDDEYLSHIERLVGKEWKPMWKVRFQRKGDDG